MPPYESDQDDRGDLASEAIIGPDGKVVHDYQTGDIDDRMWTLDETEA